MIFDSMKLVNYRQYRNQNITFSSGDERSHITVIEGPNGSGKTNLLNAITWCLYDEERHLGDRNRGLPLINNVRLDSLAEGDSDDVSVQLVFKVQGNRKTILRRRATFMKIGPNTVEKTRSKFEAFYQCGQDLEPAPDPEVVVNQHLPRDIQEYFFFHCERLDDYFKGPANSHLIKREVFKISQLALFETVLNHLKNRNDEYAKELKKTNPQADSLKCEIDRKEVQVAQFHEKLDQYLREQKEAQELEKQLQKERRTYPSTDEIADLRNTQETLDKRVGRLEEQLEEFCDDRRDYVIKTAPLVLGRAAVSVMKDSISIKDAAGLIPPPYRKSFLATLLESDFCICGQQFSQSAHAKENVEKLFDECESLTDISDELSVDLRNLNLICEETPAFRDRYAEFARRIQAAEDDLRESNTQLAGIAQRLQNVDDEKTRNCERRLDTVKKNREKLVERMTHLRIERQTLESEIQNLRREYEGELKKMHKHRQLSKKLLFCSQVMKAAAAVKAEIMNEIRAEIERLTEIQFFELIWKKDSFRAVQISDDYEISVLDQNGAEAIGTLSDGERQVLALSFIAALNEISGFDAPIVIDTPLGRISREPKSNIAARLPGYLKGRQLTILVTEEEYTHEVKKELRQHVGKQYKIQFHDTPNGNQAEVVDYA